MLSKSLLSEIRSLQQLKFRRQKKQFLAAGEKVVEALLASPVKTGMLLGTADFFSRHRISEEIKTFELSEAELQRATFLDTASSVLAIADTPEYPAFSWDVVNTPVVMLDGIRDPGNMGTIIRTADWFGAVPLLCSDDCVDCFNPKVVQAAMGSLFRVPVYYGNLVAWLNEAKKTARFNAVGTSLSGSPISHFSTDLLPIVVIGSESHGISGDVGSALDSEITIPKIFSSEAESLNAAVALGIVLSHIRK